MAIHCCAEDSHRCRKPDGRLFICAPRRVVDEVKVLLEFARIGYRRTDPDIGTESLLLPQLQCDAEASYLLIAANLHVFVDEELGLTGGGDVHPLKVNLDYSRDNGMRLPVSA